MKQTLLLALLLLTATCFAQPSEKHRIHLTVSQGFGSEIFNILISQTSEDTKIVYSKLDSVNKEMASRDKEVINVMNLYAKSNYLDKPNSVEGEKFEQELKKLLLKYSFYTRDSLLLKSNDNKEYSILLDQFHLASKESLEEIAKLNRAGALIGPIVEVKLNSEGETSKVLTYISPGSDKHPLIYKLVSETLNLYRKRHPNSFLEKDHIRVY